MSSLSWPSGLVELALRAGAGVELAIRAGGGAVTANWNSPEGQLNEFGSGPRVELRKAGG
jgi:hypothetical protein